MPVPIPTFDLENTFSGNVAGIDEVGRGPWAGPVVASAVILIQATTPEGLRDSKTLSPQKREALSVVLWETAQIGIGIVSVEEIDEINIGKATFLAMQRACADLPIQPDACLVDGKYAPELPCPAQTVIKGDSKSQSIAAASIIAKVIRDKMMIDLAHEFPGYGWESNKGYGVKAHRKGLDLLGVTPHHRRSFAPIRLMLDTNLNPKNTR